MSNQDRNQGPSQATRWTRYGLNVLIAIVAAVLLTGFVNAVVYWQLAGANTRIDLTATRRYSLAPQTRQVARDLEGDYEIVTVMVTPDPVEFPTMAALLEDTREVVDEYDRLTGSIETTHIRSGDPVAVEEFRTRLHGRFGEDVQDVRQAIHAAGDVVASLQQQFDEAVVMIRQLAETGNSGDAQVAQLLQRAAVVFTTASQQFEVQSAGIARSLERPLPPYGQLKDELQSLLSETDDRQLRAMTQGLKQLADASETPDSAKDALLRLSDRFAAMREAVQPVLSQLNEAGVPQAYSRLVESLNALNTVVVIGPEQVRVLDVNEMLRPESQDPRAGETVRQTYLNEEHITGALVSMRLQTPPLVVLITTERQPLLGPQGSHDVLAERLRAMNFEVEEWNPMGERTPYGPPEPSPPPQPDPGQPAVWVVTSLAPVTQQNMMAMQLNQRVTGLIEEKMAAGDSVFLTMAVSPGMTMGGVDALSQMVEPWGMIPQLDRVVFRQQLGQDNRKSPTPQHIIDRWPRGEDASAITRSVIGMQGAVAIGCPIRLTDPVPDTVTLHPLVEVTKTGPEDLALWAETNFSSEEPSPDPEEIGESFTIAYAAEAESGRLVVLADPIFASDSVTNAGIVPGMGIVPDAAPMVGAAFPANLELVTNAIVWLAGHDELIAASARTQAVRRIGEVSDGAMVGLQVFILGGLPVAIIAAGIGVWLVRRNG